MLRSFDDCQQTSGQLTLRSEVGLTLTQKPLIQERHSLGQLLGPYCCSVRSLGLVPEVEACSFSNSACV